MNRRILYISAFLPLSIVAFFLLFRRRVKIEYIVNKLTKNGNWENRSLYGVTDITVHHSATPSTATAESFARYHVNSKGWAGIGYHFVIKADGTIQQTNDVVSWSYHNGFNNKNAIGVCLVGNFDQSYPTNEQIKSLEWLIKDLMNDSKLPNLKYVMGHKEYAGATSCPGSNFNTNYIRTRTKTKKHEFNQAFYFNHLYDPARADN